MQRAEARMIEPELFDLVFELELLSDPAEQSVVPLLGGEVLADGRQIEDGDADAGFTQACGGTDHQAGFANLARGEHIAELALQQAFVKSLVGLSFDVRRRVAPQRPAGDVKAMLGSYSSCAHSCSPPVGRDRIDHAYADIARYPRNGSCRRAKTDSVSN